MSKPKTSPDQSAVAKEAPDLLGQCIGRDVEILGFESEREIAHTPADEVGLETSFTQAVQHPQGVRGDLRARDRMGISRDDVRETGDGLGRGVLGSQFCGCPRWAWELGFRVNGRLSNPGGGI